MIRPAASGLQSGPVLSVVIPLYNKAETIGRILLEVTAALPGVQKRIIIVDDCSADGSAEWLRRNLGHATGLWHAISVDDDGELNCRERRSRSWAWRGPDAAAEGLQPLRRRP